jgi:hypothetical protein
MPTYLDLPTVDWYPNPELAKRKLFNGMKFESVLDVGAGHGGVFDVDYWINTPTKEACDIRWIRELPKGWVVKLGIDVVKLDEYYREQQFDFVQCTEVLEHVEESRLALIQLVRVARKAVLITSCDETHHLGPEQEAIEKVNPYQAYIQQPRVSDLLDLGFQVRVETSERRQLVAWLIK